MIRSRFTAPSTLGLIAAAAVTGAATLAAPDASALGDKIFAADKAESVSRGFGFPGRSDVSISSRYSRPRDSADPYNTFRDTPPFFPTRLDWVYDQGNKNGIIDDASDLGWKFGTSLNSFLSDEIGKSVRVLGRDADFNGNPTVNGNPGTDVRVGDIWAEDYFQVCVDRLRIAVPAGADTIQVDDPGGSYRSAIKGNGGYGAASLAKMRQYLQTRATAAQLSSWGLPSTIPDNFNYASFVRGKGGEDKIAAGLKAFHEQMLLDGLRRFYSRIRQEARALNGGTSLPVSCNNSSNLSWRADFNWADWGMAETVLSKTTAKNIRTWIRRGEDRGHAQVLLAPRFDADTPPAGYVDDVRRSIATTYAMGGIMQVPWDVFQSGTKTRYFGEPKDFADLYGFIRAIPGYFDGYEEVFTRGGGIPTSGFGFKDSPFWLSGNTSGVVASLRARPGNTSRPLMLHIVDWDTPQSFKLILDPNQLFNGGNFACHLFTPTAYNSGTHSTALSTGNLRPLRKVQFLSRKRRSDGRWEVTVPAVSPWGIIRIEKR